MTLVMILEVPPVRPVPADALEALRQVQRRTVGELARRVRDVRQEERLPRIPPVIDCRIAGRVQWNLDRRVVIPGAEQL
jgi:hypothetical protein